MFRFLLAVLVTACLSTSAKAQSLWQSLPAGLETARGGAASSFPLGPSPAVDQVWQLHYDNSNFAQAGTIRITELYFRADLPSRTVNAFNFGSFTVTMSEATTGYQVGQHDPIFANNLGTNTAVVRSGPWAGPGAAPTGNNTADWIAVGITTPFDYDPSTGADLIIQIERCAGGTLWTVPCDNALGQPGQVGGNRYGTFGGCTATTSTISGNETVPVVRIDYTPIAGFEWETNDAASSATIDRIEGNVFTPAISQRCTLENTSLQVASTNTGLPFDIGITIAAGIPASAGAITSGSGQVVNLDPFAIGGIFFLNGGSFPNLVSSSFFGNFGIPFTTPNFAGDIAAQMLNADPSNADGIALSQAAQVNFVTGVRTAVGPNGDDSVSTFQFGTNPICGPADFPFYGTRYTEFHVSSNGRVSFSGPNSTFAPVNQTSLQTTIPFFGAWTDYDPSVGGTIDITTTGQRIQVAWNMVPYFGSATSMNVFALEMVGNTGECILDGLLGIGTGGQSQQAYAISGGGVVGATDPGAVTYAVGASGTTTNATDMIYEIGTTGTLAAGVDMIIFTPNSVGNYDWTAL